MMITNATDTELPFIQLYHLIIFILIENVSFYKCFRLKQLLTILVNTHIHMRATALVI